MIHDCIVLEKLFERLTIFIYIRDDDDDGDEEELEGSASQKNILCESFIITVVKIKLSSFQC